MTDADVDGAHISTLLRHSSSDMSEVIEASRIFGETTSVWAE